MAPKGFLCGLLPVLLLLSGCSAYDTTTEPASPARKPLSSTLAPTMPATTPPASTRSTPAVSLDAVCAVYCDQLEWLRDHPPCERTCTALMEDAAIGFPDKIRTSAQEGGGDLQDWPDLNLALSAYESAIQEFPLDDCRRPVLSREINRCSRAAETVQYFAGQVHLALN